MKTEELTALREEVESMNKKLAELSEEELAYVAGGAAAGNITLNGVVVAVLPNKNFSVSLEDGSTINAHLSGKLRMNYIRIIEGDRVTVEMSPYDLKKGCITWRNQ